MTLKRKICIAAAAGALAISGAQAQTVLDEGFENFSLNSLLSSGWLAANLSLPVGEVADPWFGGTADQFAAQAGSADSYAASNYKTAMDGGVVQNWLVTPDITLGTLGGSLSFWVRGMGDPGYSDHLLVLFNSTGSNLASDFKTILVSNTTVSGSWVNYTVSLGDTAGHGRIAFVYNGSASSSNYIGLDSVQVTAVPEPATYGLFALGLAGLGLYARSRRQHLG